jgi:2-(1,2-epoxy-1,2-dihydrophenyl)acetyl-CoA isomerase
MAYKTILLDISNGVATLTLNRPDKLNACTMEMLGELATALDEVAANDAIRALLLTGSGRGFCAGQDLGDRQPLPEGERYDLSTNLLDGYHPFLDRLHRLDIPTICAVNGVAAGAGANIALVCDIVVAASSAKFIQVFSKIGLVPDCGGTYNLPRSVGMARAKGLTLLAEPLSASDAENWGLIWKCYPDETFMAEAVAIAEKLAAGPTWGLTLTKRALNASLDNDFYSQLDLEAASQKQAGQSDDYIEGVQSFIEKRVPVFTGKINK